MTAELNGTIPSRQRYLTLTAALLGWGLDGVEMGVFPVVARPALVELLGAQNDHLIRQWNSGLAVAFLLGAALGGVLFGRLGDRVGRVRALALSVLIYAGLTGVAALAQSPWQLLLARFLAATGMGGEWALGVALVVETWPEKARPWLAGLIGAAVSVGYVVVALLAGFLDPLRWRLVLAVCAAPAALTFAFRWWVPESPRWLAQERRGSLGELFQRPHLRPALAGAIAAGCYLLAVWGALQFSQLWAVQLTGRPGTAVNVQLTSATAAIFGAVGAPLFLAARSRRVGYAGLCGLAFVVSECLFIGTTSYGGQFLTLVAGLGFFIGGLGGWFALYLPELFPTHLRATGQGFCYNAGRVLAAIGVGITSLDPDGYPEMAAWVAMSLLIGVFVSVALPETRGLKLPT